MSAILLFAIIFVCALLSLLLRDVMLYGLSHYGKAQFRRDERIYWVILALAIVAHNVVFSAGLVTTPVTQWGTDLALSAIVLLLGSVRFMDVYHAVKAQTTPAN